MGKGRIAVTLGDPRGVGPEIVAAALVADGVRGRAELVVFGPSGAERGLPSGTAFHAVGDWTPADGVAAAGRIAGEAVQQAVHAARRGEVGALVTAPIDKAAFRDGGWPYPGHTEMLQSLCGAPAVAMMMAAEATAVGGPLRVVLATTHLPLREVPVAVTTELLVEQGRLTADALRRWWSIAQPALALCALNPHAGDGGLFGDEDQRVMAPAAERLRRLGIRTDGPVPADTVFLRAARGEWDAVIAPYHDVGMAAFKTASFGRGVNVTLGLPFVRTSPDHGTAIDIAGSGQARPDSMIEAIRLALRLSGCFDSGPQGR